MKPTITVEGVICPGFGIASKDSTKTQELVSNVYDDKRIVKVDRTVYRQFPFFIEAGVRDLEGMYPGTINVDISPHRMHIVKPDHEVTCEWIEGVRESFWLTRVTLVVDGVSYEGYIYYPGISEQHAERDHMVEIITKRISGIEYGKAVSVLFDTTRVRVGRAGEA